MNLGATVSDLHLFSHHSRPGRYRSQILETANKADHFVLNGDIFDFKWSEHGVFERSVDAAVKYLEGLLEAAPKCRFHVILGNHDAVFPYMEALTALEEEHENLEWHEFTCTLQDRIFLHGDVIHAGSSNESLRRFRSRLRQPAKGHSVQRMAHSALHRSHVQWVAFKVLPKRILAARILSYLKHEDCLKNRSIRHVYFGHTHSGFEDFRHKGLVYHNCGSATHGSKLRVVTFPLQDSGMR